MGRKLVESIRNATVVRDDAALRAFELRSVGLAEAIRRAMSNEERRFAATRWSDAISSGGTPRSWGGVKVGSRLVDLRSAEVAATAREAFAPIRRIGGRTGWYFANGLWRLRGWIDLLLGGVGLRRGRRDPEELIAGDALDFWRVEAYEPDRRLRLVAEMKLPGRAWLEFEVEETQHGAWATQLTRFMRDLGTRPGLRYWGWDEPASSRAFASPQEP